MLGLTTDQTAFFCQCVVLSIILISGFVLTWVAQRTHWLPST